MTYENAVHQEMRDRVKELCNAAGGRKKLADNMAISYDFISDICDGVWFPSVETFELRFGPLTTERTVNVNNEEDDGQIEELTLPVTIRCPEFDTLVELMAKIGYDVRIVIDR